MIKKIYDKCVQWAGHKYAKPLLAFEAFIESSFFPIPPDVMIIPMVISKKKEFIKIALIATSFSVLGALFGYYIGYSLNEVKKMNIRLNVWRSFSDLNDYDLPINIYLN